MLGTPAVNQTAHGHATAAGSECVSDCAGLAAIKHCHFLVAKRATLFAPSSRVELVGALILAWIRAAAAAGEAAPQVLGFS